MARFSVLALALLALVGTSAACTTSDYTSAYTAIANCITPLSSDLQVCYNTNDYSNIGDCICSSLQSYTSCLITALNNHPCTDATMTTYIRNFLSAYTSYACQLLVRFNIVFTISVPADFASFSEPQAKAFAIAVLQAGGVTDVDANALVTSWRLMTSARRANPQVQFTMEFEGGVPPAGGSMEKSYDNVQYTDENGDTASDSVVADDVEMSASEVGTTKSPGSACGVQTGLAALGAVAAANLL